MQVHRRLNEATWREIKRRVYSQDFYEFRKWIAPMKGQQFVEGWWQREISKHITQFWEDLKAGKRPKLLIKSPPQHGKSQQVIDAIIWFILKEPRFSHIFASYSDRLGVRANKTIQRVMSSPEFLDVFPEVALGRKEMSSYDTVRPARNNEHIEFWPHGGSFRNTTIEGKITGEKLDIGFIDDVVKGRKEISSEQAREDKWAWFTDDFFSRFSENAGFICIGTNWHVDDPMQRMINSFPEMKVISYPAIATEDEEFRKEGEPLFPELKSLNFLLERKAVMAVGNFQALYQQDPTVAGGNKFKERMIVFCQMPAQFDFTFIVVDTSYKSKKENDWTVATHFGVFKDELYVNDVWRVKIDASEMELPLIQFIIRHRTYGYRYTWIEPKGHGIYLNQKFKTRALGIPEDSMLREFFSDRRLDKVERANNSIPHLATRRLYINIDLKEKDDLKSEMLQFPNGKHDDFVDTVIDGLKVAFGKPPSILDVL